METEENNKLIARNLGKNYGKKRVVCDINIEVSKGEVIGLLGPNGAGKTTSFYMISGTIYPDYGQVIIDGKDVTRFPMYKRAKFGIGYLPQETSIFRGMNVEDNILAALEISEHDGKIRGELLEELLEQFSISHLRKMPSIALSGGERRRVEIARCFAIKPKYILLDEPLTGIDPIAVSEIRTLIRSLTKSGIGIIITDHNVKEALSMIDKAYIIYEGRVLAHGSPDEITSNEEVKKLYLGEGFQYHAQE